MQNETFEFMFSDKGGMDERSFFLFLMPRLVRPEERPSKTCPVFEGVIAGIRGDKEPPFCKDEFSPSPDTFYSATYNHTTGGLEVNVLTSSDDPDAEPGTLHIISNEDDTTTVVEGMEGITRYEPLAGDAWDLFYRHATFEEILGSVAPDGGDQVLARMQEFYSCDEEEERTRLALQIIRDSPDVLTGDEFVVELIQILKKARWSTDKAESESALNLLKDHLLPMRPGGRIPLPPNIRAIRGVLEALAKHLSNRCRSTIPDGVSRGVVFEEYLDDLTEWARENIEFRLSRLPRQELKTLILKPMTYVDGLLEAHFHSSVWTMMRSNS